MDTEAREASRVDIERIVGGPSGGVPAQLRHSLMVAGVLALLTLAATIWQHYRAPQTTYVTQPVALGSLTVSLTATGTLEPRTRIEIGSELSGTVRAVYVQVNAAVRQGQVLAELDTARLEAQLVQAQGAVAFAEAQVHRVSAVLTEATASLSRLQRLGELSGGKLPAHQDLDLADAAVARARGEHAAALAAVAQARANRELITTDLDRAQIRSPVSGLVLARSIEPGQTVAASFQAPVLFMLAADPNNLELHVAIDEADIGAVEVGQQGTFTVDAFPERVFTGMITRVHMASNSTGAAASANSALGSSDHLSASASDVVTYETVLEVDNSELLLRPGMTATVEIATRSINNVTLIPNAAMRFTPRTAHFPGEDDDSDRGTGMMALMPYLAQRWKCPRQSGETLGCVWVFEDGEPVLVIFKPGATDRSMTQVLLLERLPNWSSLTRLRNDPIMKQALLRRLTPGVPVIVDDSSLEH